MSTTSNFAGRNSLGAQAERYYSRKFPIQTKDFTSAEKGVPIRILYGTTKVSGVYFTPIFGFVATPTTQKIGK